MRKALAFILTAGLALSLSACGGQPSENAQEPAAEEQKTTEAVKTAQVGDKVPYESASGNGEFTVTVDGFERSQVATDDYLEYGNITEGYSVCYLLVKIEDVSVDMDPNEGTYLTKLWLEDASGVTLSPMNSGNGYGEYESAPGGFFYITVGQTKALAIPYAIPDGAEGFTVVIDGTDVPVDLIDGNRPMT